MPKTQSKPTAENSSASRATKRVIVVDDHELLRFGLTQLISSEPDLEVCGEAEDARTALALIRQHKPDLAIIDISLTEGNGLELIKQVKAAVPSVRMIVSSMHDERLYAERALRAGASGYVSKQEPARTIISAIHRVLTGNVFLSEAMTTRLVNQAVGADQDADRSSVEMLSDRELEVFEMIGVGQTVKQIARTLHLSPKTVEYHRENIKQKLGLANSTELTRTAVAWTLQNR